MIYEEIGTSQTKRTFTKRQLAKEMANSVVHYQRLAEEVTKPVDQRDDNNQ